MAMVACRECGEFVSKSAKACPYCGISHPGLGSMPSMTTIIIVLVLGAGIAGAISNQNSPQLLVPQQATSQPAPAGSASTSPRSANRVAETSCTVTMSGYSWLKTDMTYSQATNILGCYGEEISRSEVAGYKTVAYMWRGDALGANMNAMFQNDRLVSKAQFGLK